MTIKPQDRHYHIHSVSRAADSNLANSTPRWPTEREAQTEREMEIETVLKPIMFCQTQGR